MSQTQPSPLERLFGPPYAKLWLPAFAAAAIGDPVAGAALAPFIGPATERIQGGGRARVPGEEHFARTWAVIKPGFLGMTSQAYAQHTQGTRNDHRRTRIPGELIALPIQWIQVMTLNVAIDRGMPGLAPTIWEAGVRFARDIEADQGVVRRSYVAADIALTKKFERVDVPEEPGRGFWRAMDHGIVRRDLGGIPGRVDVAAVQRALHRHLPSRFVRQFMQYAPRR